MIGGHQVQLVSGFGGKSPGSCKGAVAVCLPLLRGIIINNDSTARFDLHRISEEGFIDTVPPQDALNNASLGQQLS